MIQPDKIFDFGIPEHSENSVFVDWSIPAGCPYLDGHFPDLPIFPAVGLIDGSIELIRRSGTPFPQGKLTLKKAKFTGMVAPGMRVRVSLLHKENRLEVEWKKLDTHEPLASFQFLPKSLS
jgi:3-hydroxymyristoyl/3-hydroxydecanoyl-(acyl carrier protein) dehydratase